MSQTQARELSEQKKQISLIEEGLRYDGEGWSLEVEKTFGDKALVWLWIKDYDFEFEGWVLAPVGVVKQWIEKDDPEYYDESVEYVIGETTESDDCEHNGVVCYTDEDYLRRIFVNHDLLAKLRQYIDYSWEWDEIIREGRVYNLEALWRAPFDHTSSPTLKLPEEEEVKLARLGEKIYGYPRFPESYYHLSTLLKHMLLGDVNVEWLSDEEKMLIEMAISKMDRWLREYLPREENYNLLFRDKYWHKFVAVVCASGGRCKEVVVRFMKVGEEGWLMVTEDGKDLREYVMEFVRVEWGAL